MPAARTPNRPAGRRTRGSSRIAVQVLAVDSNSAHPLIQINLPPRQRLAKAPANVLPNFAKFSVTQTRGSTPCLTPPRGRVFWSGRQGQGPIGAGHRHFATLRVDCIAFHVQGSAKHSTTHSPLDREWIRPDRPRQTVGPSAVKADRIPLRRRSLQARPPRSCTGVLRSAPRSLQRYGSNCQS